MIFRKVIGKLKLIIIIKFTYLNLDKYLKMKKIIQKFKVQD